jgi:TfoX/Sxy family transcriptional regulator of competence genes
MTAFQQQLETIVAEAGISERYQITYKSVFGAIAAYADERIFLICGKFGMAAKLPGETCQTLMDKGIGAPLKYFEKGHVKRNYVVLRDDLLKNTNRMRELLGESAAFVQNANGKS